MHRARNKIFLTEVFHATQREKKRHTKDRKGSCHSDVQNATEEKKRQKKERLWLRALGPFSLSLLFRWLRAPWLTGVRSTLSTVKFYVEPTGSVYCARPILRGGKRRQRRRRSLRKVKEDISTMPIYSTFSPLFVRDKRGRFQR